MPQETYQTWKNWDITDIYDSSIRNTLDLGKSDRDVTLLSTSQFCSLDTINRVLTLTTEPVSEKQKVENVDYKFIHLFDAPAESLLDSGILEESLKYIDEAIENEENVVVHCIAAVSRSVTICIAYQMWKNQWTLLKATKMIESVRKSIGINPGFLAQLQIWERCGMSFDKTIYKNLKITIPELSDPDLKTVWLHPVLDDHTKLRFKCRQCRKVVFNSDDIVHPNNTEKCQKYLIQPMEWLRVDQVQQSFTHICGAKLGSFNINGSRCTGCNKFVKRWIFIDKSKVDKVETVA